jgi:uncharacterized protein YkwD
MMRRVRPLLSTLLLAAGATVLLCGTRIVAQSGASSVPSKSATLKTVASTAPDIPFDTDEFQAEQRLLQLANESRLHAGLGRLDLDAGLSKAARDHALTMLEARKLSHQFRGEPALAERLASATDLWLDREGENVALDYSADGGHKHLMLSPPHRANLLNPSYNVVGLGVVRSGDRLYIVQDFGHALPNYSVVQVKAKITAAVQQKRLKAGRRELSRRDLPNADDAACSMARADRLGTPPVRELAERFTVLTYTSYHPETLPQQAFHAIASPHLRSFSIGTCSARTSTYPTGVYWVVLTLD